MQRTPHQALLEQKVRQDFGKTEELKVVTSHKVSTSLQDRSHGILNLLVLPVTVHHESNSEKKVDTYALLDSMSDASFVKTDLLRSLDVEGESVKIEMTMMNQKTAVESEVVRGLMVKGMTEKNPLHLSKVYGRNDIPAE